MVGRKIGNGACAVVYELNDAQGNSTDFAIKVTPEAKKTAKPPLLEVQNASLLNYERMVYQNHFAGIQGKLIPSIPSKGPPVMSNVNGKFEGCDFLYLQSRFATNSGLIVFRPPPLFL